MSRQRKAYLLALAAILFWSTAGSAFKLSLDRTPTSEPQLLLFATAVSLTFLAIWQAFRGRLRKSFRLSRREWINSAIMGALNPFGYYIVLFKAYNLIQAQEAVALNYVWPLTLVLLSIPVLKQKISMMSILALLLSFSGIVVIVVYMSTSGIYDDQQSTPLGIFLALASSLFWAGFWLMNMKDRREEAAKLLVSFLFGFIYILIYLPLYLLVSGDEFIITLLGLAGSAYIGIFEMGLTFVLWLKALQLSSTTARISNLVYISPFLSLLFVSVAVGETIQAYTIVGLVLIVGGIVMQRTVR